MRVMAVTVEKCVTYDNAPLEHCRVKCAQEVMHVTLVPAIEASEPAAVRAALGLVETQCLSTPVGGQ